MDLRLPVLSILVGGCPAPGINGVISAATIEAINNNHMVIGLFDGYKHIKNGDTKYITRMNITDVVSIYSKGGSYLRTSKEQLENEIDVDNAIRALRHLRVKYLITIGGVDTAKSTYKLSKIAKKQGYELSVVHVPKSLFNDLPLPKTAETFGYSTAIEFGSQIVRNYIEDAKSMGRWYIVNVIGSKAGHLSLGIGKSSASTLTLIQEQFTKPLNFSKFIDHIDICIIKREALGKMYGVILVSEGLVDIMSNDTVNELFGSVSNGHLLLANKIVEELEKRSSLRNKIPQYIIPRYLGYELRATDPNAHDTSISRELGFGAFSYCLDKYEKESIITMIGQNIKMISLDEFIDGNKDMVKKVDINSVSFIVAEKYMIKLDSHDLNSPELLYKMSTLIKMNSLDFLHKFKHIVIKR